MLFISCLFILYTYNRIHHNNLGVKELYYSLSGSQPKLQIVHLGEFLGCEEAVIPKESYTVNTRKMDAAVVLVSNFGSITA